MLVLPFNFFRDKMRKDNFKEHIYVKYQSKDKLV